MKILRELSVPWSSMLLMSSYAFMEIGSIFDILVCILFPEAMGFVGYQ